MLAGVIVIRAGKDEEEEDEEEEDEEEEEQRGRVPPGPDGPVPRNLSGGGRTPTGTDSPSADKHSFPDRGSGRPHGNQSALKIDEDDDDDDDDDDDV
ncbi:nucleoplasmin-like protein ANO39 isoform X3 [Antennarius striatus]|uniref:nucleoplasmin-like protein ANO39 isoform X3 n=1 Tax=Antennarius striatus TaxID=241820 RepID=UPI0035AE6A7A